MLILYFKLPVLGIIISLAQNHNNENSTVLQLFNIRTNILVYKKFMKKYVVLSRESDVHCFNMQSVFLFF